MTATSFDPFRTERALRWRNRLAQWREQSRQTALHGVALVMLAVLVWPLGRHAIDALSAPMLTLLERWSVPMMALLVATLTWRQARRRQDLVRLEARDWWVAQPIPASRRTMRRRAWQALEAALQFVAGIALLLLIGAPAIAVAILAAAVLIAWVGSPWLARHLARRETRRTEIGSRLLDAGVGRLWRWQRIETGVALGGRALAFGLWALLLVPMGSGPGVVLVVLAAGLLVAILASAWSRSVGVLPQAHAWLRTQPARGRDWFAALWAVPLAILVLATAMAASVLVALGAPTLALGASVTLGAMAVLQFACNFAWRDQPGRIPLQFILHFVLLVGMVQALAPLAMPLWIAQVVWLLRRGWRL